MPAIPPTTPPAISPVLSDACLGAGDVEDEDFDACADVVDAVVAAATVGVDVAVIEADMSFPSCKNSPWR